MVSIAARCVRASRLGRLLLAVARAVGRPAAPFVPRLLGVEVLLAEPAREIRVGRPMDAVQDGVEPVLVRDVLGRPVVLG